MAKDKTSAVINALNKAYPEYLWFYAIAKLCNFYDGVFLKNRTPFGALREAYEIAEVISSLCQDDMLERKVLTPEDAAATIENLINRKIIKDSDLNPPDGEERTGYRWSDTGLIKRVRLIESGQKRSYRLIPETA